MRTILAGALLPAAAFLALGGCANTLPEHSTAAVPSTQMTTAGTVISPSPAVTTTTPMMMSNGSVVGVPANGTTSVVTTTTTTPGTMPSGTMPPGTVTYVPMQTASVSPGGMLPARLSSGEILSLLADNTATGVASNGQTYYLRFARDGRVRFREGNFNDSGSWRITNDDRLCSTMTKTNVGVEQCYSLYRDGSNVAFERNGTRVGSFTVLSGDPQNL